MDERPNQRFPKDVRLRKRADYLKVQDRGTKAQTKAFIGLVLSNPAGDTRLGITTSKRLGTAVVRNRTRRLIREAFRTGAFFLPTGVDCVVIARSAAVELSSQEVREQLALLGERMRKLRGGKTT